jgi:putative colanic acid biosynthesis acetyltransferase WcaB
MLGFNSRASLSATSFLGAVRLDFIANRGSVKCFLMVLFYRIANLASVSRKSGGHLAWFWAIPVLVLYRFLTEWVFHYEIPAATSIGAPLVLDHGFGIVINKHAVLGGAVRIKHNVTIGCKTNADGTQGRSPVVGSSVDIGAGACIIGDIRIGDRVKIGANATVTKDVPNDSIAVGNPARIISRVSD